VKHIKQLPSFEHLNESLLYNRRSGKLFWRKRPLKHFKHQHACSTWNTRWVGKEAFVTFNSKGYLCGELDSISYLAHRVIWKLMTGKDPTDLIDHRDRNKQNNRWDNLRGATNGQNMGNSEKSRGVWLDIRRNKWRAHIRVHGRLFNLGEFSNFNMAQQARAKAVKEYFGEFAP
jgi:hypothetical protein